VVDIARLAGGDRAPARPAGPGVHPARARRRTADGVAGLRRGAHARLAARFAAKEATRKALGDLRLPFHAVEVRCADDGAPELYLHGRPAPLACSLSHDGGVAMAVVVGPGRRPARLPRRPPARPIDPDPTPTRPEEVTVLLEGKKLLITGVLDPRSIAFFVARSPRNRAPRWC
jgi:hypothetical protein